MIVFHQLCPHVQVWRAYTVCFVCDSAVNAKATVVCFAVCIVRLHLENVSNVTVLYSSQKFCRLQKFVYCFIEPNSFYARKQLLFQLVLAIAILSVRPTVTRLDQSKTVQARITKSSSSAAWKTLVSGTVKIFHKFEGSHPERGH